MLRVLNQKHKIEGPGLTRLHPRPLRDSHQFASRSCKELAPAPGNEDVSTRVWGFLSGSRLWGLGFICKALYMSFALKASRWGFVQQ